jgi:hypothetical protein
MRLHGGRALSLALLAAGTAAALTGCGSGGVDAGGMTAGDRKAAQAALDGLRTAGGGNIPLQILSATSTAGKIPAACRVHLISRHPATFKVYVFWIPYVGPQAYTWFDMTVTKDASTDKFYYGTEQSELPGGQGLGGHAAPLPGEIEYDRPLKYSLGPRYTSVTQGHLHKHAGNAFEKPGAACYALKNGSLRLVPNK